MTVCSPSPERGKLLNDVTDLFGLLILFVRFCFQRGADRNWEIRRYGSNNVLRFFERNDRSPERTFFRIDMCMQERLGAGASGIARRYDLSVGYGIAGEGIAIQPDSSITRLRFIGRADWTLRAQDPARTVVTNGRARVVDDLNIFQNQYFAADLENEAAQRRIANVMADQITMQLAIFFKRRALQAQAPA